MLRRLLGCLLILVCLLGTAASAETQAGHYITREGGIYYASIEENGSTIRFPVYCMNRELKWPVTDEEYWLDVSYLRQFPGLYERVQRLLFAGYPTNGINLYTLGEKVVVTETQLARMLEVPDYILNFTNGGSGRFFDLAEADGSAVVIKPDGTGRDKATAFINKLLSNEVGEEDKRLMQGSSFYLAIFHLNAKSWNVGDAIRSLEAALQPTDYNMWQSTQVAMYQLLKDYQVPNNTAVNLGSYPYAKEMYEFAISDQPPILLSDPGQIQLQGTPVFRKSNEDGKWYSNELKIAPTVNYDAVYNLVLPQGYACIGADAQKLRAGRSFRLVSDDMPAENDEIRIEAEVRWPSDVYHFKPAEEESVHQHMAGVYYKSAELSLQLNVRAAVPQVPATGDGYPVMLLAVLASVSAAAMMLLKRDRKKA